MLLGQEAFPTGRWTTVRVLPATHVDGLAEAFALLCSTPVALDAWRTAEGELQAAITGRVAGVVVAELTELGRTTQTGPGAARRLPFTELRRRVVDLG